MPGSDPVVGADATAHGERTFAAVTGVACTVFLLYAGSFLFFFVDDEAIPLVYARNLLRGRGLVYTSLEGRVEGYSDFLHVLWSAGLLAVTRTFGFSPVAPLLIGKAVSLLAAIALLLLTAWTLRRAGASSAGLAAGLGFLALSGPLAVWSASSLEAVTFAALLAAFAVTLYAGERHRAVVAGILLILMRIDGAVYAAAVIAGALAAQPRRWRAHAAIVSPVAVVLIAYQLWRVSYFGSWLTAPMAAKVLHRLNGSPHDIVKAPEIQYVLGFLRIYGLAAALPLAWAAVAAWRAPAARLSIVVLLLLGIYVDVVDDWMFGFRFMVALLPFLAVVIGIAITRVPRAWQWMAAGIVIAWSSVAASTFIDTYRRTEHRDVFWTHPQGGEPAWLGRYFAALTALRPLLQHGDRISYNQAGLIPYLLDVENIDDLGICSGFVARLPTRDVYFTGVGRYSPLTNDAVLHTAQQYLLYRDVRFIVAPMDLLLNANEQHAPDRLLNNAFERVGVDALGQHAIYRRTGLPTPPYATDPRAFTENLSHSAYVLRARVDGQPIADEEIGPRLPFLRERTGSYSFAQRLEFDVTFARHDEAVSQLYVARLVAARPGRLVVTASTESGQRAFRQVIPFTAGLQSLTQDFPAGARAAAVTLSFEADQPNHITLTDLRVTGQSPELHRYVLRTLHFPGL